MNRLSSGGHPRNVRFARSSSTSANRDAVMTGAELLVRLVTTKEAV